MKLIFDLIFATLVLFVFDTVESTPSFLRSLENQPGETCPLQIRPHCAPNNASIFQKTSIFQNTSMSQDNEHCFVDPAEAIVHPIFYGFNHTEIQKIGINTLQVIPANTTCGTAIKFTTLAYDGGMILSEVEFFDQEYIVDNPAPPISNFTFGVEYNPVDGVCSCKRPCVPLPDDPRFCSEPEPLLDSESMTATIHSCPTVIDSGCTRGSDEDEGPDEVTMTLDLCDTLGDALDCCSDEGSTTVYMVSRFMTAESTFGPKVAAFGEGLSTGTLEAYTPFELNCGADSQARYL